MINTIKTHRRMLNRSIAMLSVAIGAAVASVNAQESDDDDVLALEAFITEESGIFSGNTLNPMIVPLAPSSWANRMRSRHRDR